MKKSIDIAGLQSDFMEMEERGEVDTGVIDRIGQFQERIIDDLKGSEGKLDRMGRFKAYFFLQTQVDILEEMKKRLKTAGEKGDNPQVVEDSISILDSMRTMGEIRPSRLEGLGFDDFLELQRKANKLNLFPDTGELKKRLSLDDMQSADRSGL